MPEVAGVGSDHELHLGSRTWEGGNVQPAKQALVQYQGQSLTGKGTTIAIIDTGVDYRHPDLGGCLGPGCKVKGGYDVGENDPDPMENDGHGTFVAGIAAANGAMQGVAPEI